MIVFSGNCNDEEQAARDICRYGGQVWVQEPQECNHARSCESHRFGER
jgi:hypothetical protein